MNFPGNLFARQLLPFIALLLSGHVMAQNTIDVSSACVTGTIVLSPAADVEGKPAFEGTGSVAGFNDVDVSIYWSNLDNAWFLAFGGQPYFQYVGDTDSPPNNVPGNWAAVTGTELDCPAPSKINIGGSGTQNDPLPVTLVAFNGRLSEKSALLEWSTTDEDQNKGFEILHSLNLKSWNSLGFVTGAGTTKMQNTYTFVHATPSSGQNYYRLKQSDFSGKTTLSRIINVENPGEPIVVYPNPVLGEIFFSGDASRYWKDGQILDMQGKHVKSIQPGKTTTSSLSPGKYLIRLTLPNGQSEVLFFVKTQ